MSYQESWDNSGLQVGNPSADIRAALLTTDITESVVSEAVLLGCNLIISHHPLLFRGVKHICGSTPQERCIIQAIRHDIAIYSAHTSMDAYIHGVSGRMAEQLGIPAYRILSNSQFSNCPIEHGLGVIGKLPAPMPFEAFLSMVKSRFQPPYLRYTPPLNPEAHTIAL